MTDYQEIRTEQHEEGQTQRVATFKFTQLIWLLLVILEALIGLRVLFKLIAVNPSNTFAALLYGLSDLFVAPFASLTAPLQLGSSVFETSSIIAMIVYLLIAWAFERFVYLLFYRPRGPVRVHRTVVSDHVPQQVQSTTVVEEQTKPHTHRAP